MPKKGIFTCQDNKPATWRAGVSFRITDGGDGKHGGVEIARVFVEAGTGD